MLPSVLISHNQGERNFHVKTNCKAPNEDSATQTYAPSQEAEAQQECRRMRIRGSTRSYDELFFRPTKEILARLAC